MSGLGWANGITAGRYHSLVTTVVTTTLTDPTGHCPICIVGLVSAAIEIGSAVVDAVSTIQTWQDPEASLKEKVGVTGLFLVGAAAPGGGYATGATMAVKMAKVRQMRPAGGKWPE